MAIVYFSGRKIRGLSSDTKPTAPEDDSKFYETNTKKTFDWNGSAWVERTTPEATAITANTAKTGITGAQASAITSNTAKVSLDDNSVTVAKLAHGTADKYLGFDSSGVPEEKTVSTGVASDTGVQTVSTTIGDYTTGSSATSSSASPNTSGGTTTANLNYPRVNSFHNFGTYSSEFQFLRSGFGSPTHLIGAKIYGITGYFARDSGSSTGFPIKIVYKPVIGTIASQFDFSGTFTWNVVAPVPNGTLFTEKTCTDNHNHVMADGDVFQWYNTNTWGTMYYETPSGSQNPTIVISHELVHTFTASNNVDNDTATIAKTNSEANAWIAIGLASSSNITQVAIYLDSATTETEIKIQTSPDNSVWTDKRTITVSNLSTGAWNYIRMNNVTAQYLRVYGSSGVSKIIAIGETKIMTATDGQVATGHGHLAISSSDTSLALNGE